MTVQNLYLAMVVAAFGSFAVTLFTVSVWSKIRN
jgi:hypothetical protein